MKKIYTGLFCSCFLFSIQSLSQTWNGSQSNDWNNALNWTPNNVPTTSGNVIINKGDTVIQPVLPGNVSIRTLNMSAGFLNLNGFALTCSVSATLTGDSLRNGKIISATFNNVANMHMGGKIIFDRTGSSNEFWQGNNKFYGDSLIIIWRSGGLSMESAALSPDSVFGNLKLVYSDNNETTYRISIGVNSPIYIQNDLILDNPDKGTFGLDYSNEKIIGGNIKAIDFSSAVPNFPLSNVTTLGNNANGPFYCHTASLDNCTFNGNFTLVADSNATITISHSLFLGADNLFQAGNLEVQNNSFGQIGTGNTILRVARNLTTNVYLRDGNNKFFGSVQWETYAVYPGAVTIQQNYFGADSCLGNMSYLLKGNAALTTNGSGHNYVAGNVTIDGQGARKLVQFTGGAGNTFNVDGSFTVKNFTPFSEPGAGPTNVYLRNLFVTGSDTVGTFYCYTGDINGSSFNGNFKLIADSSQVYGVYNSSFFGANNLFQAGTVETQNDKFGKIASGTTILRSALNSGSNLMRDGNNKFLGNAQWEAYALYPGSLIIQQNYFGVDTCLGNMNFILKGNTGLTTNGSGHNYVAGNVTIDGQGARKLVQFTGGAGNTFNVDGSFTVKNFTPFSEPGAGPTNVYLRNLFVTGSDTVGTFYCYTGDINGSSFNGNFKLIADSSQVYGVNNSFLLGADNLLQAGIVETQNNKFGKIGSGTTILRSALSSGSNLMRDGNNKFFGNAQWDAFAPPAGAILIQQTFFGVDTCLGNVIINLNGPSSANLAGNGLYIGKGLSLQNNGSGTIVHDNGSFGINFIGTDTANYVYGGTGSAPTFLTIVMNRKGGLRLLSPLTYHDYLVFTRGIILSSSSNPVIVPASAVVIAPWDSSYVDGPVKRIGNTTFTFPLGRNNIYAPLSITAPSLATDAFTAQYFNHFAHADGFDSTQHDFSLNHLSRKEYWTLERTAGSSNINVRLSWKTLRSGVVNSMTDLRVAHWNGTTWKDEGNGGTTGNNDEGTIQSLNAISSFSPFTLASIGPSNPLPVRFITFDVQSQPNKTVLIQWSTASEINNDHFDVQRSSDGIEWTSLRTIMPVVSGNYSYVDLHPFSGVNFYRVKQVDFNSDVLYTEIRMINIKNLAGIYLWPNPVINELHMQLPFSKGMIEIVDGTGKTVITKMVEANNIIIPVTQLSTGTYFVRIKTAHELHIRKFVKI